MIHEENNVKTMIVCLIFTEVLQETNMRVKGRRDGGSTRRILMQDEKLQTFSHLESHLDYHFSGVTSEAYESCESYEHVRVTKSSHCHGYHVVRRLLRAIFDFDPINHHTHLIIIVFRP